MSTNLTFSGEQINQEIKKGLNEFGYPRFFQYYHGLIIDLEIDNCIFKESGTVEFYLRHGKLFEINPDYLMANESKPSMLFISLDKSLVLRQERTDEILGWLYWPVMEAMMEPVVVER